MSSERVHSTSHSTVLRSHSTVGVRLFTKCLIPNPKKSWTTSEIAKELGVPLQAVYRHLQWLREVGFLTEDFPGKAEDPKTVRLWHYDLEKAWDGVENRARICLGTYKEIIDNLNRTLKEAKNQIPDGIIPLEKDESLEIDLREIRIGDERSYEEDLGLLGRGIGLLSNHHSPYSESMPYKILDECFFQRPDRAWTAEEIAALADCEERENHEPGYGRSDVECFFEWRTTLNRVRSLAADIGMVLPEEIEEHTIEELRHVENDLLAIWEEEEHKIKFELAVMSCPRPTSIMEI